MSSSGPAKRPGTARLIVDEAHTVRCSDAVRSLHYELDGESTGEERRALAQHLEICSICSEMRAELRFIAAALCEIEPRDRIASSRSGATAQARGIALTLLLAGLIGASLVARKFEGAEHSRVAEQHPASAVEPRHRAISLRLPSALPGIHGFWIYSVRTSSRRTSPCVP